MSVMTFLLRFLPGRRADIETTRIMAEYRSRRAADVERRDACLSKVRDDLDTTQEIIERVERRWKPQPDEHPNHHAPNGA